MLGYLVGRLTPSCLLTALFFISSLRLKNFLFLCIINLRDIISLIFLNVIESLTATNFHGFQTT